MAKRFKINKNEQYIECHRPFKLPNGKYSGIIRVYELLNPKKQNMLTTMDWSFEPEIVDPNTITGYNSLEIDGQLADLEKLVQDLCNSRLRVNKLGYCYFQVRRGVANTTETYGFTFYRMNDVLKWSDYGVMLKLDKPNPMTWARLDILHGGTSEINDSTVNNDLQSQVQKLTDQVKELQLKLDNSVPKRSFPTYYVPATRDLFHIVREPVLPKGATEVYDWKKSLNIFGSYTPTCVPANVDGFIKMRFTSWSGLGFDTSNWFFVAVKELAAPVLIYEGTEHSVTVAGHTVSSPLGDYANYISYFFTKDYYCPFGIVILTGIGARVGVRYQ
ncbi:hypothetical protein RND81_09G091700 [Saponaria officinalis]|uniref:Uncharacterized protein n=1 Tax=Saponaria officinalis TaxID=3572 RepID=A0AAW1IK97_SAPOF